MAFVTHDEDFSKILGPHPTLHLLVEHTQYPFAHEAGVYLPATDELFVTSNRFCDAESTEQRVQISKISFRHGKRTEETTVREEIDSSAIPMGNGGVNYGDDAMLFCAQGSRTLPSGLYKMGAKAPYNVSVLVSGYHGRPFNSVNDVVVHSDGSIWFTDPPYGFEQGYRDRPQLPSQVYRYDVTRNSIRAMADGLGHPNGICFSPDERTVYITDTDWLHGSGVTDHAKASTM